MVLKLHLLQSRLLMILWLKIQKEKRILRRQELQELRKLQRDEQRQQAALSLKLSAQQEALMHRIKQDEQELARRYDHELDGMERTHKAQIEAMEKNHDAKRAELVSITQKEHDRERRAFNDELKQSYKQMKQELQTLPKKERKEVGASRKLQWEANFKKQEETFNEAQVVDMRTKLYRLAEEQRRDAAATEKICLLKKQDLHRARESEIWKLEEKHLQERYQVSKQQVKDQFHLQRQQLVLRHDKEEEQMQRHSRRMEDEMIARQRQERLRLPKIQQKEAKVRMSMFKKSLRISSVYQEVSNVSVSHKDKVKQFSLSESKRQRQEKSNLAQKHSNQQRELAARCEMHMKELQQLQNEKRRLLVERESEKIKNLDEQFQLEIKLWREQLRPRKQQLEQNFARDLEQQRRFYNGDVNDKQQETATNVTSQDNDEQGAAEDEGTTT